MVFLMILCNCLYECGRIELLVGQPISNTKGIGKLEKIYFQTERVRSTSVKCERQKQRLIAFGHQ
jgi:hypothetical protein